MNKNKPKSKAGRPNKYGEPTTNYQIRAPLGAIPGLDKLCKEYLKIYLEQKQLTNGENTR